LPDAPADDPYLGLTIVGRAGPIDDARSEVRLKRYPARSRPALYGLYFDPATWDGSDLFVSDEEAAWPFATSKVERLFREASVRNIEFVPATTFERTHIEGSL
jgi:hypothetical protein